MTFEGGHLAEYEDPPFVTRGPEGTDLLGVLRAGEINAAIFGNDLPHDDDIAPVFQIQRPRIVHGTQRIASCRSITLSS